MPLTSHTVYQARMGILNDVLIQAQGAHVPHGVQSQATRPKHTRSRSATAQLQQVGASTPGVPRLPAMLA